MLPERQGWFGLLILDIICSLRHLFRYHFIQTFWLHLVSNTARSFLKVFPLKLFLAKFQLALYGKLLEISPLIHYHDLTMSDWCLWKLIVHLTMHFFSCISELWISQFFSTMVKIFTLVHQNPSLWGYFRARNVKIFFDHGEIVHISPWKSITLGAFQS